MYYRNTHVNTWLSSQLKWDQSNLTGNKQQLLRFILPEKIHERNKVSFFF